MACYELPPVVSACRRPWSARVVFWPIGAACVSVPVHCSLVRLFTRSLVHSFLFTCSRSLFHVSTLLNFSLFRLLLIELLVSLHTRENVLVHSFTSSSVAPVRSRVAFAQKFFRTHPPIPLRRVVFCLSRFDLFAPLLLLRLLVLLLTYSPTRSRPWDRILYCLWLIMLSLCVGYYSVLSFSTSFGLVDSTAASSIGIGHRPCLCSFPSLN